MSEAVRAFAADAYDNAKMDDIAAGAGITKPVLYDHFPSKRALFQAVLESLRDGLIAKGKSIVQDDVEPEPKFRRAIGAFFLFVEQQPEAARVLLSMPTGNSVAAELSREVQVGASARLAVLLATFMRGDASPRVQAATEFLEHGLHALGLWWFDHPDVARAELVDIVMRVAWLGLQTGDAQGGPSHAVSIAGPDGGVR